jgi:hypothetical protein
VPEPELELEPELEAPSSIETPVVTPSPSKAKRSRRLFKKDDQDDEPSQLETSTLSSSARSPRWAWCFIIVL